MKLDCDVLVIGSGPGGAMTATVLAEAGLDVLIVEEGDHLAIDSAPWYSLEEMNQKYRNGGLNTTLGAPGVTYLEGRCVGGGSEVNAGLYHRPVAQTLDAWARDYRIEAFGAQQLEPHIEAVETELEVSKFPESAGPVSERIAAGAHDLGWKTKELARFWRYRKVGGAWQEERRSMTVSLIPRALAAGARLLARTKISRLHPRLRRAVGTSGAEPLQVHYRDVVVCCGAVQTPALLRRSGVRGQVGQGLTLNPMIRVAARFPDQVNHPELGVPVQQIEEFKPAMTLGGSHSALPHLALWLAGQVAEKRPYLEQWQNIAVFYAKIAAERRGSVRWIPGLHVPFVRFPITDGDLARLGEGLVHLGQLLFAMGAIEILNPIRGAPPIQRGDDLAPMGKVGRGIRLTAIHLHSSCPMGELPDSVTDSWGRLNGARNVWINDASVLPDTPGINPQGLILAVARRNAQHFLEARGAP